MVRVCLKRRACYKAAVTRCRVAIVGAGFAGLATARALARRGVSDVIVLERAPELGRFASGRSAGLGRQLAEDDDTTALTVRGARMLRELPCPVSSIHMADAPASGVWRATGGMLTFDDPAHADAYVSRAARFGVAVELVDRATRWPELASLRIARALWVPSDGTIDVAVLLGELAKGVRIELGTGVVAVERGRVTTTRGELAADFVVDATGAWAGELTDDPPLAAFKRHVFVVDAGAGAPGPWLWHLGDGELYVRAGRDGLVASPCDATPCAPGDQQPDAAGEEALRRLLAPTGFASAPIVRRWACQRAFTQDRKMRLGRDPLRPWLVWAAGLGGHGATAALAVGERVAESIT
jgi:D-arginine dehydrogenase